MIKKTTAVSAADVADALSKSLTDSFNDMPNMQLPSPQLKEFYEDYDDRIIWLDSEINTDTLEISRRILKYNKQDKNKSIENRKPIKIFIDTPGGNVSILWQIVNIINLSKTPVWTINFCEAMSAGSIILASGHKRFAFPGTTVLIHSGSCCYTGNVEQVENAKKYYDNQSKLVDDTLLKYTKIDSKEFKKKKSADWYLTAEEALERGVIDKIIESFDEVL